MQFSYDASDSMGRASLRAHRESGDTPLGVSVLTLDRAPMGPTDDQIAVAATLAFGLHARTQLEFPGQVSPAVSAEIQRVTKLPVVALPHDTGDPAPDTARTRLVVSDRMDLETHTPLVDETRLVLVPSERFSGGLVGVKEIVVASNAWLFGRFQPPGRALAAVAVLFANDLLVGHLELPTPEGPDATDPLISDLCLSLGIGA